MDFVTNRVILVIVTAVASSVGTAMAAAYPSVHAALCGGTI